jgi:NADPH:quinone reductase
MMPDLPATNLTMLTLVKPEGHLELSLARLPLAEPKDHEVVVKVLAAPINPSDLGLLVGAADVTTARASERDGLPVITADVPAAGMRAMASRMGEAMPIGNEGCGIVVKAGASPEAQALLGKTVALLGGALYAEYRCLPAQMCMLLPDGTDPKDGASCFVNPLTALAFTEVMRNDGHTALVHTAAASNLGQMLVKICKADGIPLVNIVRSAAQVALLKDIGATFVLDSTSETFNDDLTAALVETGATCAFDAIGGGKLTNTILTCMEAAAVKQIYVYGMLDPAPLTLTRSYGFAFAVSGFLLTPFLAKAGMEKMLQMRARIVAELKTTFASHYSHEISLTEALNLDTLHAYNAKRTGEKYLIRP